MPAEHSVAVAEKLGEMNDYVWRLIRGLAAVGFAPGVNLYDRIATAQESVGAAQRFLTDPFAEPGQVPATDWII